nr:DNA mismatch repair protein MSH4 [Ipomoea batatas]
MSEAQQAKARNAYSMTKRYIHTTAKARNAFLFSIFLNKVAVSTKRWTTSRSGLMLAGVAGLPSSVVETAKRFTSTITQKHILGLAGRDHPRLPCVGENPTRFNHRASIPDWFQLVFLPSSVVDQLIFTQLNTHHISSLALLAYPHLGFQRINLPGGHRVPEEYPGVRLRHHRGHTGGAEGNGGMLTRGAAPEIIAPDNN